MNRKLIFVASLGALVVSGLLYLGCQDASVSHYRTGQRATAPHSASLLSATATEVPFGHQAEPGTLPSLDEEVWVIVRPDEQAEPDTSEPVPGCGAMMCIPPGPDQGGS